jgi:alkylation response protein AidB-like acyl-CoA dehydrogenase
MDFSFSEEQLEVRGLAQKILGDQTENEHLRAIDQQDERFDRKLWSDLAEAGLLGVSLDERFGGMEFGFETLCILIEEAGRTVAPIPVIPVLVSAAGCIQKFAPEAIRQTYLPDVASGEQLVTAAMIEPGNENASNPACRAEKQGQNWRLSGVKHCVPFAAQAERVLLSAMSDDGLLVCLVNPRAAGVTLSQQKVTTGENQYEMLLENVLLTELVAQNETAEALVKWQYDTTTAAYSAMAVGLCDKMMRMTSSYTSEREQFGVALASFQAVKHGAANCFIDVECLRLVSQQAVSLLDQELDASEAVLVAKAWTGDVCHRVSQASQHMHGGIGVDRDYPLFRFCLWARHIELSCGSSAEMLAVLGKKIAAQFSSAPEAA